MLPKPLISLVRRVYAIFIGLSFMGVGTVYLPILFVIEKILLPEDRSYLWRLVAHKKMQVLLKISRIKLHFSEHIPKITDTPSVFVSNHSSMFDGFIFFSIFCPEIIPLTQPIDMLAFPFNIWFKRMGLVDVKRDDYDKLKSETGRGASQALKDLVDHITLYRRHILIFPEGHIERQHKLHYIHTGAARVAIRAKVPVVPMGLVNVKQFTARGMYLGRKDIYVRAHKPIHPPVVTEKLPFRKAVKEFSKKIEEAIISILPSRNIPIDINERKPERIGVFFDIDNTLYRGYSQQDFVKYLMERRKVSPFLTIKVFFYLFLEKLGVMSHEQLMTIAMSFTKGWQEKDIEKLAEEFFNDTVVPKFEKYILPIMKDHQERNHTIMLVTEVIEPLAKQFKEYFKAKAARGTVLEVKKGVYTGRIKRLCWEQEKAHQVRELVKKHKIDLKKSYAYGDSYSDIHMLGLVKHKVVVNPKTKLKHEAMINNWNIIN